MVAEVGKLINLDNYNIGRTHPKLSIERRDASTALADAQYAIEVFNHIYGCDHEWAIHDDYIQCTRCNHTETEYLCSH